MLPPHRSRGLFSSNIAHLSTHQNAKKHWAAPKGSPDQPSMSPYGTIEQKSLSSTPVSTEFAAVSRR